MKKIILSIIFITLVVVVLVRVDKILCVKHIPPFVYKNLNEPYNVELLFLGTSRIGLTMHPLYIFKKYGVVSYNLASSSQSYKTIILLLKKYKPKYAVIDLTSIYRDYDTFKSIEMLNMFPFYERISVAKELFGKDKYLYEINTLFKYHSRWKELNVYKNLSDNEYKVLNFDFTNGKEYEYLKGSWIFSYSFKISNNEINFSDKNVNFESSKIIINSIMDTASKAGTNILFIIPTNIIDNRAYHREFIKYAIEKNIDFIDYNNSELMKKINLDYKKDMMDVSHLNMYGSYKVTDDLIEYLMDKYRLKDERKNSKIYHGIMITYSLKEQ